jgi:hypothetical protein
MTKKWTEDECVVMEKTGDAGGTQEATGGRLIGVAMGRVLRCAAAIGQCSFYQCDVMKYLSPVQSSLALIEIGWCLPSPHMHHHVQMKQHGKTRPNHALDEAEISQAGTRPGGYVCNRDGS